jgi:RNA polymerase sigma-70 factor (ECF subfamily)
MTAPAGEAPFEQHRPLLLGLAYRLLGSMWDEIATILQVTPAAARQLQHRAAERLADGTGRFTAEPARHEQLLTAFLTAAGGGDWSALADLLAEDVVLWADGGGRLRAALQPVGGREAVVRFLAGLAEKYPVTGVRVLSVNGQPAVELVANEERQVLLLGVEGGHVGALYIVRNPDKLTRV